VSTESREALAEPGLLTTRLLPLLVFVVFLGNMIRSPPSTFGQSGSRCRAHRFRNSGACTKFLIALEEMLPGIVLTKLLGKLVPEHFKRHYITGREAFKRSFTELEIHIVAGNNSQAISLQHRSMPVLPASDVELAVPDPVVDAIDCSVGGQVRLPSFVHLDWPDILVAASASLLHLGIRMHLVVIVDRPKVHCTS